MAGTVARHWGAVGWLAQQRMRDIVDEGDDLTPVWMMFGVMIAFKVGITLFILIAYPSAGNLAGQIVGNWVFLVLIAVLVVPPAIFWGRLLRGRAKRGRLLRAEWNVDGESSGASGRPRPARTPPERS